MHLEFVLVHPRKDLIMKFSVIYADPPWTYRDTQSGDPARGGKTYPTLTLQQVKNLGVQRIAAPDCALFLWATMPLLREALEVIEAWGFKYTTCAFTWVKLNPTGALLYPQKKLHGTKYEKDILLHKGVYSGMGYWTNGNAELCLFAKQGHPKRVARNVKQIVLAPRGRHSAKPSEVRDRIVQLMGDVPRIELFAREQVAGWVSWGNEVPSQVLLE